jgi:competence protein ComEA
MGQSFAILFVLVFAVVTAAASLGVRRAPAADRPDRARPAPGQRATAALLFGDPIDLNAASAEDLAALPGIGPVRAERIVALRTARGGRFSSVEELLEVSGIGRNTVRRIRGYLFVTRDPGSPPGP